MKKSFIAVVSIALFTIAQNSLGQVSITGNIGGSSTDYVGWDNSNTFDLEIKHEGNRNIRFYTNNNERMRLQNDGTLLINAISTISPARLQVLGNSEGIRGIASSATATNNIAGRFIASGGTDSFGARGLATSNNATGTNIGIAGEACNAPNNYGVYGISCDQVNSWAGYFDGKTFCTSGVWDASDENLKTNIADLSGATDILMDLNPKTYDFIASSSINLPSESQFGVLAQELETIIPQAVTDVRSPARFDEEGNEVAPSVDFKAVNYNQIIPVLIAGFKEQAAAEEANASAITDLQERLAELENQLAIAMDDKFEPETDLTNDNKTESVLLKNAVPNPFDSETQINYEVITEGLIRVDIVGENGDIVESLINTRQTLGEYSVRWNSDGYPAGIYFCVIRHDGDIQIEKMIKR